MASLLATSYFFLYAAFVVSIACLHFILSQTVCEMKGSGVVAGGEDLALNFWLPENLTCTKIVIQKCNIVFENPF